MKSKDAHGTDRRVDLLQVTHRFPVRRRTPRAAPNVLQPTHPECRDVLPLAQPGSGIRTRRGQPLVLPRFIGREHASIVPLTTPLWQERPDGDITLPGTEGRARRPPSASAAADLRTARRGASVGPDRGRVTCSRLAPRGSRSGAGTVCGKCRRIRAFVAVGPLGHACAVGWLVGRSLWKKR